MNTYVVLIANISPHQNVMDCANIILQHLQVIFFIMAVGQELRITIGVENLKNEMGLELTIWISRDLEHKVQDFPGNEARFSGKVYRRLTPMMFARMYHSLRCSAKEDKLTSEQVQRITALEATIHRLGLQDKFYERVK